MKEPADVELVETSKIHHEENKMYINGPYFPRGAISRIEIDSFQRGDPEFSLMVEGYIMRGISKNGILDMTEVYFNEKFERSKTCKTLENSNPEVVPYTNPFRYPYILTGQHNEFFKNMLGNSLVDEVLVIKKEHVFLVFEKDFRAPEKVVFYYKNVRIDSPRYPPYQNLVFSDL